MTPSDASAPFRPYLLAGERILWTGRPRRRFRLNAVEAFGAAFGILWCVFGVFWIGAAIAGGAALEGLVFGLLFLLLGGGAAFGPILRERLSRRRTVYAVTDCRVIMLQTGRRERMRSHDLAYLPALELVESAGGEGSIHFDASDDRLSFWFYPWVPSKTAQTSFDGIPDARRVYELIRRTARAEAEI